MTPTRSRDKYRLLGPRRPEEHEALRADIARRGVLQPIEVDDKGHVLDGHQRREIAEELGIDCPQVVRHFASEAEKVEHVLKVNLLHRQPGPVSWARAFARLLELREVRRGQGSSAGKRWTDWKKLGRESATVADLAGELGVPERTARHRLQVAEDLAAYPDLAEQVDLGAVSVKDAMREVRRRSPNRIVVGELADATLPASIQVLHRDARDRYPGEPEADLAVFSPPYNVGIDYGHHHDSLPHDEWLDLLETTGKVLAGEWRVGRICVNFPTGIGRRPYVSLVPDVLDAFGAFECEGVIVWDKATTGNRTSWGSWRSPVAPALRDRTESIAVFRTENELRISDDALMEEDDGRRVSPWLAAGRFGELTQDLWRFPPESAARIGHPTPFPVELPRRLIELYGWPGCTVIDPFAGSGTTGVAALELGAHGILIDIDESYVALMIERLQLDEGAVAGESRRRKKARRIR